MAVESRNAFKGTSSRWVLTREKLPWNGMALSRENAHVDLEAAQETEMVQNIPVPNTIDEVSDHTARGLSRRKCALMNH